jgi:hypothetical protein
MKTVYYLLFIINILILSGCSSLETIHSGALNVMQTEFPDDKVSYKRISSDEINYRSFCGMNAYSINNKVETVNIFNFNGETIQTGTSGSFGAQLLSFLFNAALTGIASNFITDQPITSVLFGLIGGGIINQTLWEKYHYKNAIGISNKVMIDTDPKIDFYVNPSYSIRTQSGLFNSKHSVTANSIGVKLQDDLFTNNFPIVESIDKKQENVNVIKENVVEKSNKNLQKDDTNISRETIDNVELEIVGCTDDKACNFNSDATSDDGSCLELDQCGVCGGFGIPEGACDCEGNRQDALGVCGGLCESDDNNDGICDELEALGPLNFTLRDKLIYTDNKGNEYDASILFFEEDGCYKIKYKTKNSRIKRYFICPNNYDNLRLSD